MDPGTGHWIQAQTGSRPTNWIQAHRLDPSPLMGSRHTGSSAYIGACGKLAARRARLPACLPDGVPPAAAAAAQCAVVFMRVSWVSLVSLCMSGLVFVVVV